MTNKQAAKILREYLDQHPATPDQRAEALELAITALKVDFKTLGAEGIKKRNKKYTRKDMAKWGAMGGRPRNPPKEKAPK